MTERPTPLPLLAADAAASSLLVHEIYASIQGESSFAGIPCTFVRTTGCNLRCHWCDTPQAFSGGRRMPLPQVLREALSYATPLVEVTGGEPLLQPAVLPLLGALCDAGRTVLLETSGERDVSAVDARVHKIMDLKAPGSGECGRNRFDNLAHLSERDEIKFVLTGREDYDWMRSVIEQHGLGRTGPTLLVSGVWEKLPTAELVAWVLADALPVRVQLQLHKVIWGAEAAGV